jgi:hypothetical protein
MAVFTMKFARDANSRGDWCGSVAVPVLRLGPVRCVSPGILPRTPSIRAAFYQNIQKKPLDSAITVFKRAENWRICGFRLILRAHLSRSRVWLKF